MIISPAGAEIPAIAMTVPTGTPATDTTATVLAVRLSEYETLKDEQIKRIERRDHLVYATLTAIAGALVAADTFPVALLLLPAASLILGWTHLINDVKVSAAGAYLRGPLRERLEHLTGTSVLGWEDTHRADPRRAQRKRIQLVVDLATFVAPALVALGGYAALTRPPLLGWVAIVLQLAGAAVLAQQQITYADVARFPAGARGWRLRVRASSRLR